MEHLEKLIKSIGKESVTTVFQTISDIKNHLTKRESAITEHEQDLRQLIEDFKIEEDNITHQLEQSDTEVERMIRPEERLRIQELQDRKKALNYDLTIIKSLSETKINEQRRELDGKRVKLAQAVDLLKKDYLQFATVRDELNAQKQQISNEFKGLTSRQETLTNMLESAKSTKVKMTQKLKSAHEIERRNIKTSARIDKAAKKLILKRENNKILASELQGEREEINNKRINLAKIAQKLEAQRQSVESDKAVITEQMKIFKVQAERQLNQAITSAKEDHQRHFEYELKNIEKTRQELYSRIDSNENEITRVAKLDKNLNKKRIQILQIEETLMLKQVQIENDYNTLEIESKDIRTRKEHLETEEHRAHARTKGIVNAEVNLRKVEKDLLKREKNLLNKEEHLNLFESKKMSQWESREQKLAQLDETLVKRESNLTNQQTIVIAHELKINESEKSLGLKENKLEQDYRLYQQDLTCLNQGQGKLEKQADDLQALSGQLTSDKQALKSWENELVAREKRLNLQKASMDDLINELERERRQSASMREKLTVQLSSLNSAVAEFRSEDSEIPSISSVRRPQMDA